MKSILLFIIGITSIAPLSAEDQKLDIVVVRHMIRGKLGETVHIPIEAVNKTSETLVIRNIIRTGGGVRMNGVSIRDGNRVYSSRLSATWDTRKKSPIEPILLKPEGRQRLYIPWKIKGNSTLKLGFGDRYHAKDATVKIRVSK